MAATNIFYRIPSQRGTKIASIAGTECPLNQFCDYLTDAEGLNKNDFFIASGTKVFRPNSCSSRTVNLQNNSHVDILIPLLGGKGGFGSLLRAIGAQIEKTTNRDACRDLSGRRLRDIKREDELRKLIALQEKLKEERKRRRKDKIEKLKKKADSSKTSSSIQELVAMFDDHAYNKRRLEICDIIEAAVEKGIIKSGAKSVSKREVTVSRSVDQDQGSQFSNKDGCMKDEEDEGKKGSVTETLACPGAKPTLEDDNETKEKKSTKRKDLWLGLDDEDEAM